MSVAKMEDEDKSAEAMAGMKLEESIKSNGIRVKKEKKSASSTPNGTGPSSRASSTSRDEVKAGSEDRSTIEVTAMPKLPRKATQKVAGASPVLFESLADVTEEACKTFQVINDCLYGSRNMGASEHDALDCDCAEEWRK
jgi:[histone H3]-lysine36 N-trimethyltransferase